MIAEKTGRRPIGSRLVVGAALGSLAGIAGVLAAFWIAGRDTTPRLTLADYEAAERRWAAHGPTDYNQDLELFGNRPGKIHVEVRGGQVTHMTRDGVEPRRRATWDYWSVPGQLDTISQELDKADDPAAGFGAPPGAKLVQQAQFNPQYGYPLKYHRIVLGANLEIGWQVTQFEALNPQGDIADPPADAAPRRSAAVD